MSKLLVYIAGASARPFRERTRKWMRKVCAPSSSMTLTLDWLSIIEHVEAQGGGANEGLTDEERREYGEADWQAVRRADVVWVLAPENSSTGAWCELAFALAHNRFAGQRRDPRDSRPRVLISGPASRRCIFAALAQEFDTDEAAYAHLLEIEHAWIEGWTLP